MQSTTTLDPKSGQRIRQMLVAGLLVPILGAAAVFAGTSNQDDQVEALAEYARLYGYVRWFHPSDEGANINWDRLAVLGAGEVLQGRNADELKQTLERVFLPVAPTLKLRLRIPGTAPAWPEVPATGKRVTYWQHAGVKLVDRPSPYRSRRVIGGETAGDRRPLFSLAPGDAPVMIKPLGRELEMWLPLVLPVDVAGRTGGGSSPEYVALKERLAGIEFAKGDLNDPAVRVAGVVIVWNVLQHFQPYHAEAGVNWEEQLRPALRAALEAATPDDYLDGLCRLLARLQDGHGVLFTELKAQGGGTVHENVRTAGGLPVRVAVVEGRITVTGVKGDGPLRRGDIITSIDGIDAMSLLAEREQLVSGSPQLRRHRALNRFGQGPVGHQATVAIDRDGGPLTFAITLGKDDRGYFSNVIPDGELPDYAEVAPGIFYVNLTMLGKETFASHLDELARARGVIFDWRWNGKLREAAGGFISVTEDVIPHLTGKIVQAAPMLVPQVVRPDREGWTWWENTWPVKPAAPLFKGQAVFIDTPGVGSYGETCMAIIDHFKLATLVGEPTAGCNGNINFIPLPGGASMMWTGMQVLKHDRSQLYLTGYRPAHPLARTLTAVKDGRDEMLARAIAVIEESAAGAAVALPPARQ
jgi:hypothetical protein